MSELRIGLPGCEPSSRVRLGRRGAGLAPPVARLLVAGYTAATLGALLISLGAGLFGFRESATGPYVAVSLAIEGITVVALITWVVLLATTPQPPTRHPEPVARQGLPGHNSRTPR